MTDIEFQEFPQENRQLAKRVRKVQKLIKEARQVYGVSRAVLLTVKPSRIIRGGKLKISPSEYAQD